MATIIILMGSVLGVTSAVTAFVAFDLGIAPSLLIWLASGPVSALLAIAFMLRPAPRRSAEQTSAPHQSVAKAA